MFDEYDENVEKVGTFDFGSKTDVTDPCYNKDVWCRTTVDTVPGRYNCYVSYSDEGDWGRRVSSIVIVHTERRISTKDVDERIGEIGVDAGLAGFFNGKPDYDDEGWSKIVDLCDFLNKDRLHYYFNSDGFFSDTGFGDGTYEVRGRRGEGGAYDMLQIIFIGEDDEEEEDYYDTVSSGESDWGELDDNEDDDE